MNNRTAAIILTEDLLVLRCTYQRESRCLKPFYTFVSRAAWVGDLDTLQEGDYLIAQSGTLDRFDLDRLDLVQFVDYGDVTDLDLMSQQLVYKWVLGVANPTIMARAMARAEEAEANIAATLKAVKRTQISRIKEAARLALTDEQELSRGADWKEAEFRRFTENTVKFAQAQNWDEDESSD